ncbi:lipase family protein [Sandaracinus amylolyticus]|uniref:Putative lipase n=1 Tax=Sandaracinus amylolyticus TaxID=927083 RepID=A0A0F6SG14_9BACT|nr:lipase family protein [Sandaracinus amylolyticus]AKF07899.1 Putative lipase [Sandaracinus amylolyticus]
MLNGSGSLVFQRSIIDDPEYRRIHGDSARDRAQVLDRRIPVLRFAQTADGWAYSPAAAYVAATASAWAYSDPETLRAQMEDLLEVPITGAVFPATNAPMYLDTNAFFLRTTEQDPSKRLGILVYRGTELTSVGDVLADAFVETVPFPARNFRVGNVHGGFYFGMEAVWKRVYSMLVHERVGELIIAGHSLGAAMAVLTAAQIVKEAEQDRDRRFRDVRASLRGVYTFGQPAVGDAGFARWMDEKRLGQIVFRHAYGADVVPYLPTSDVAGNFEHFVSGVWTAPRHESALWIGPNHTSTFPVARWFAAALATAGVDFVRRRLPFKLAASRWLADRLLRFSFDDHSPANYLRVSKDSFLTDLEAPPPAPPPPPSPTAS